MRRIVRAMTIGLTASRRQLWMAAALAVLAGCATSPATRFYVLTPVATASDAERVAISDAVTIGIRRVTLPEELDRPQIVVRTGANAVHIAEFDRWAAPLRESIPRQIAANLAALLPRARVEAYPWTPGVVIDRQVVVDITQLDGALAGRCMLRARWTVFAGTPRASAVSGESTLSEPCGRDYASLVAAQSRLLAALSVEIVPAVRNEMERKRI